MSKIWPVKSPFSALSARLTLEKSCEISIAFGSISSASRLMYVHSVVLLTSRSELWSGEMVARVVPGTFNISSAVLSKRKRRG